MYKMDFSDGFVVEVDLDQGYAICKKNGVQVHKREWLVEADAPARVIAWLLGDLIRESAE